MSRYVQHNRSSNAVNLSAEMWHRTEKRALLGKSGLSDRLIDSIPGDSIHRGPIVLAISIRSIPYNLLLSHWLQEAQLLLGQPTVRCYF